MGLAPIEFIQDEVNNNIGDFKAFRAWVCENYEDGLRHKKLYDKLNSYEEPSGKQIGKIKEIYESVVEAEYSLEVAKRLLEGYLNGARNRRARAGQGATVVPIVEQEEGSNFAEHIGEE